MERIAGEQTALAVVDGEQVVSFRIGDEVMGVSVELVSEIVRIRKITEIPQVAEFIQGVINLRGHIIPVIGLRSRLGLPAVEETSASRIIVVEVDGESIGMVVDAVEEVVTIAPGSVSPPSPVLVSVDTDFVRGIARLPQGLVILVDVHRVTALDKGSDAEPRLALAAPQAAPSLPPAGEGSGGE